MTKVSRGFRLLKRKSATASAVKEAGAKFVTLVAVLVDLGAISDKLGNKPSQAVRSLLLGISLIAVNACGSTQEIYESAYFSHDVDKLEAFIQKYPSDRYTPDAKRNQAKWLMEEANKNPSIETYEALLKKYPHNPNLYTQANKKLSALVYDKVQKQNSLAALEDFVSRFPFSRERHFAEVQIDDMKLKQAVANNSLEAYKQYLAGKPSSQNRQVALNKIAKMELDEIQKHESIDAYKAFIEKYKDSPLVVEATNRMINMQLPSSIYDSKKGAILIRWGKVGMINNHQLNAHFGENQKQKFMLSKNLVVCNDQKKRIPVSDLPADSDITLASFANQNQAEVFAIYLGEVKTKMVDRENVLSPQAAIAFKLPSCFPAQVSANP